MILAGFVALSLFLGLFFVINKGYGYSMGDAFTLASYVVAVGALVCSFLFACHFPRCRCWDGGSGTQKEPARVEIEYHELQAEVVDHGWAVRAVENDTNIENHDHAV